MSKTPWALSRRWQIVVAAGILCIGILIAFVLVPFAARRHAAELAAAQARPTPAPAPSGYFKVAELEWQGLRFARVTARPLAVADRTDGSIVAADDATSQILSPYTGRVTAVAVTVGDRVQAGQPLFTVDGEEYAQAQNDLAAAIRALRAADVQRHVTAVNRGRLLALESRGGAALKDIEQSAADLAAAQAAVENDRTAVALVRSRLRVLGFTDAAIDRLAAQGNRRLLPTRVTVRAPIAGTITQRAVGVGQDVQSAASGGGTALLTISDMSRVFFSGNVDETAIASIHVGDPVSVRLLALPKTAYAARVRYIAPQVDPVTHRVFVRAQLTNPRGVLKPGMYGTVTIATRSAAPTLTVPESAVIYEEDTARVWIAGPDHTLALRYIRAGESADGEVAVEAGLAPGDRVVTAGAVFIDRALRGDE